MGLFTRRASLGTDVRRDRGAGHDRDAAVRHLDEFVVSRSGVEVYVEPATVVTETTVALVAATGEWTRRRIGSPRAAAAFGRRHGIPVYDAGIVGYPQRMREWTRAHAAEARQRRPVD